MGININNWGFSTVLGIQHGQVNATLTNYPVLLCAGNNASSGSGNLPNYILDTTSPYCCSSSSGADLRFSSDSTGTVQLAQEIVHFTQAKGGIYSGANAEIWVNIPSVSSSTDTTFYMWHHNPERHGVAKYRYLWP